MSSGTSFRLLVLFFYIIYIVVQVSSKLVKLFDGFPGISGVDMYKIDTYVNSKRYLKSVNFLKIPFSVSLDGIQC